MEPQPPYRKTFPISWEQLHRDSKALAWRLLDNSYFQGIVAVTRGGLVPAAIVSRELGIRLTSAYQFIPEYTTAALIAHHPDARYFSM